MPAMEERCVALVVAINSLCDMEDATDEEKATYLSTVAQRDSHTKDNLIKFYSWDDIPGAVPPAALAAKTKADETKADSAKTKAKS